MYRTCTDGSFGNGVVGRRRRVLRRWVYTYTACIYPFLTELLSDGYSGVLFIRDTNVLLGAKGQKTERRLERSS